MLPIISGELVGVGERLNLITVWLFNGYRLELVSWSAGCHLNEVKTELTINVLQHPTGNHYLIIVLA